MPYYSINGWEVLDQPEWGDPRLDKKPIPGVPTRSLWMRREVLPLFLALAAEYHVKIAPLDVGELDDWSYSYRPARGSSSWSNHASGTAVDLNANAEGALGTATASWWKTAKRNVKAWRLRRKYEIVNWGGWTDYADDPATSEVEGWGAQWSDPMHWELKKGTTVADVQRVIAKLGIQPDGTVVKPGKR